MTPGNSTDAPDASDARDVPDRESESDPLGREDDYRSDWAWRAKIRANPKTYLIYRVIVGVVGAVITVGGLVLIPAPGPGWLIVFLGLAVLASEFEWASRLLDYAKRQVGRWTDWAQRQSLPVRLLLGLGTLCLLVAIFWVMLRFFGVPGFVPDGWVPSWSGLQS